MVVVSMPIPDVPVLLFLSLAAARKKLLSHGYRVVVRYKPSTLAAGTVMGYHPLVARPGSQVTITVAKVQASRSGCSPHYTGACVPIASDVDCAGGGGDGPAYVSGPVNVADYDIYDLDGYDNDGVGCES